MYVWLPRASTQETCVKLEARIKSFRDTCEATKLKLVQMPHISGLIPQSLIVYLGYNVYTYSVRGVVQYLATKQIRQFALKKFLEHSVHRPNDIEFESSKSRDFMFRYFIAGFSRPQMGHHATLLIRYILARF